MFPSCCFRRIVSASCCSPSWTLPRGSTPAITVTSCSPFSLSSLVCSARASSTTASSGNSSQPPPPPPSSSLAPSSSDALKGRGTAFDSQGQERDWAEPTLADLDRSIPQVDCKFIADLIRNRNKHRNEFLEKKKQIKAKLTETVRQRKLGETREVEDKLIEELSDAEKELLLHTRPEYDDGFVLIDCRTVNEITSWGIIEGAKVLPAHEMFEAFHMPPEEFANAFGFEKPRPEETIIFYCQYGPRSLMAAQILSWLGYERVLHFREGYHQWAKQYNLLVRRYMEHDRESGNDVRRLAAFQAAKELQREIAPEFNALPMKEAAAYELDETRSRGTLKIGEGLRAEALEKVRALGGEEIGKSAGMHPTMVSTEMPDGPQKRLNAFMEKSTGVDGTSTTHLEDDGKLTLGEAQAKIAESYRN